MAFSFSSAWDAMRGFARRCLLWVAAAASFLVGALGRRLWVAASFLVGAVALFVFGREWLALFLGYAEIAVENGETVHWPNDSKAKFSRDYFLFFAALGGMALAFWRGAALDRQSQAAAEQAKIGNLQARNESDRIAAGRFWDAVRLLTQKDGKTRIIDARIGGIYALQALANSRIAEYGAQVVRTLIAYIKQNAQWTARPQPAYGETPKEARTLGEDVKAAFKVLAQLLSAREKDSTEWDEAPAGVRLSDGDISFAHGDFSWLDMSSGQVGGLHRYIWNLANLEGANLRGAKLQDADFQKVNLRRTDLWDANLRGARLSGAKWSGARLRGAQLQGAKWSAEVDLQGADLEKAQLQGANLPKANLREAKLQGAELQGADLRIADFCHADLEGAQLQGANLSGAKLRAADLPGAQLQGANLRKAELHGARLPNTELQYADLSNAELNGYTDLPSDLPGKIWHSGQPELSGIAPRPWDAEWDLSLFLESGNALAGVLRNFALRGGIGNAESGGQKRAKALRKAARKLLDAGDLPKDFPRYWRNWLAQVNPDDGSHPDDPKPRA